MIRVFIKEFCNSHGLIPSNKKTRRRYALIVVVDGRNKPLSDFVITRKALPVGTLPGDKIEILRGNK